MKRVTFISRSEAIQITNPPPRAVIISIHDNRENPAPLSPLWLDRETFCFDDTDVEESGLQIFDEEMARRCLYFVRRHEASADELVVHCQMGVSRSAAFALYFSESLGIPCFKGQLPVDALSYKIYNKKVYRSLAYADLGDPLSAWM